MKTLKTFLRNILILITRLYPYSFYLRMQTITRYIRSYWLSHNFGSWGKSSLIKEHCDLHGLKFIHVGSATYISEYSSLAAWPEYKIRQPNGQLQRQVFQPRLSIGNGCHIGAFAHITCTNSITIGDNCRTGFGVTITDNSHGDTSYQSLSMPPQFRPILSKGPVVIERNVWIGDKVTILPGVTIGEGAVIAANSVVSKDVPPYTVVGGNPAKVIRQAQP